jgi:acetoin utilization protein AcuB
MPYTYSPELICIASGSTMLEAQNLMSEKRIRHLPVIDKQNKIISMLSQHDLTGVAKFRDLPVDLFASSPVEYVTTDTPLSSVALVMLQKKISSVLLANSENQAVGIITTDDMLFQFSQLLKEKEEKGQSTDWDQAKILTTAGEFFKKLSDIGI